MSKGLQIVSGRIIRENIINENGDILGEIRFNPHDPTIFKKFWALFPIAMEGERKLETFSKEIEAIDFSVLEEEINSVSDAMKVAPAVEKIIEGKELEIEIFNQTAKVFDELFGDGVTAIVTQGYADFEMLKPIMEFALPYFEEVKKERDAKSDAYKIDKKSEEHKK